MVRPQESDGSRTERSQSRGPEALKAPPISPAGGSPAPVSAGAPGSRPQAREAVKNSVYVLPRNEQAIEDFQWVRREIVAGGGDASVCEARFVLGLSDTAAESLFSAAREADYAELTRELRRLQQALERSKKRPAARKEQTGAALVRLRRRLGEVAALDFFGASGREIVLGQLAAVEAALRPAADQAQAPKTKESMMAGLVTIPTTDLAAGDVLLYRGTGWLAKAIRHFDGTEVNHAGLFVGPEVVEALAQGVVELGLEQSLANWEFVLARRLKQPVPLSPVCAKGLSFVGTRYAYEQLLLLAVLSLTRKPKVTPVLRFLVRRVLDAAVGLLNEMIQRAAGSGSEPMICSELVYRSFDEAVPGPDDIYSLRINDLPAAPAALTAGGPAAVASRFRGRGISPDSLLAWAASPSTRVWSGGAPAAAIASAPARTTVADLEAAVQEYLDEVMAKAPVTATLDAAKSVGDQDLRQAIDRFAAAYHQVEMKRLGAVTAAAPGEAFQHLLKTAADFVTPGDLLRTESLFTVGYLQLP